MKARVWTELQLNPETLAGLESVADVISNADMADLPGVDAVITGSTIVIDGDFMDQAGPALKVIARPGIGVDNVQLPAATKRGILVVNTPDAPTESTAEHTVALLLALATRVVMGDMSLRGADISRSQLLGTEMRGRLLGVIGFGRIGRRVAEICRQGLGMKVIVYDPYVDKAQIAAPAVNMAEDLDTLLAQVDFLTLHTPLTSETQQLIGERELRQMKAGAYLVNASRGPVVDEAALAQILAQGHLAGAALDVFDPEPPEPENPLFNMPNVVVTPHIASFTGQGVQAMQQGVIDQVRQVLQGERPSFLLNPEAWPGRTVV